MKRISLLSILLFSILCAQTQARDYYHIPLRYRTHWSPYSQSLVSGFVEYNPNALNYKSNGLINYRLEYSPYALTHNSNGLIDHDVEHNPYAFSYNSSGLVSRTSGEYYCNGSVLNIVRRETCTNQCRNISVQINSNYTNKTSEQKLLERKANLENQKAQLEKNKQQKANDPSQAIREFLDSKNIQYNANRSLRIEGETVSINFNIEDANIIIKFWNSKAISEFAENDKHKKDVFDNYLESWKEYCLNNIGNSKKVYNIFAANKEDIFKLLSFDDDLNSDNILYASAQKQDSLR
ncbi:MAG: hypothetical protein JXA96_12015 [Sedimentisphaerales bacterium]|nr:hypothetical protein [Sedimentisphaerales bacterium]